MKFFYMSYPHHPHNKGVFKYSLSDSTSINIGVAFGISFVNNAISEFGLPHSALLTKVNSPLKITESWIRLSNVASLN